MSKELDALLSQRSEWLRGVGPVSDIVMSSRIRLARNLEKFPFSTRATKASQDEVFSLIKAGFDHSRLLKNPLLLDIEALDEVDRQFLVERHLVSREHVSKPDGHKAVAIGAGEVTSVMINEEDHLRIQTFTSGLQPKKAYEMVDFLDDELDGQLDYATSGELGYLTACPTNVGTGIRLSVMMHLPALKLTNEIERVRRAAKDLHLAVRGYYGEGSESAGDFYQISNQVTLGRSEDELLVSQQIVDQTP